jgi:hypothetical protein
LAFTAFREEKFDKRNTLVYQDWKYDNTGVLVREF